MEDNRKLVIAALVILLGGNAGSVINGITPNVRHDPMTGTRGDKLEDRIEYLELDVESCKDRNSNHREQQAGEISEIKAKTKSNEYLIKQCMHATGQRGQNYDR